MQISDSHIGFDKPANQDVVGTLEECVRRINALPHRPSFVMHTGDHVHLSTPAEFDKLIASEITRVGVLARNAGITPQ